MPDRRRFVQQLTALGALLAAGPTAAIADVCTPPTDPTVPRQFDLRTTPGYYPPIAAELRVYRDGQEVQDVVAYDIDSATVVQLARDPNGWPFNLAGEVQLRTLTGRITVRREAGPA